MAGLRATARSSAGLARQSRLFSDAMGSNTQLEKYILGNGLGRVDDPDHKAYFLARKDDDAPVESFTWSGQGAIPPDDGTPILIGWFDGQRRIIGPDVDARIAQGGNPKTTNSSDNRLNAWTLKESFTDWSCQAIGTVSNPSTKVIVFDNAYIDETYTFQAFLRKLIDLGSLIPDLNLQRLVLVAVKPDKTLQAVGSTPKNMLDVITPADTQECVDKLYPRANPVAFWLLADAQTSVTPADRFMDARAVFNLMPPRMTLDATTDPTVSDDESTGYGIQSRWTNATTHKEFVCVDSSVGAALWVEITNTVTVASVEVQSPDGTIDIVEDDPTGDALFLIDVADDAIDLTKLAHGTPGKVIGFNGLGEPAELDAGEGGGGGSSSIDLPGTAGEDWTVLDNLYFDPASATWFKIDTNAVPIKIGPLRGVASADALEDSTDNAIRIRGALSGYTGLSVGEAVYASPTAGGYTQTKPSATAGGGQVVVSEMSIAMTSALVWVDPRPLVYLKRESLPDNDTLTIVHHGDPLAHTRHVAASATNTYTSDVCVDGTASASSFISSGYEADKAFDNNTGTLWHTATDDTVASPQWIEYDFGVSSKTVRKYTLRESGRGYFAERAPQDFKLQYYDGATWQDADSRTGQTWTSAEVKTFTVAGGYTSTKWRVYISRATDASGSDFIEIAEVEMMEVDAYQEACTIGRWSSGTRDIAVRFDDGASGDLETSTTFKNTSGGTLDVTCSVQC